MENTNCIDPITLQNGDRVYYYNFDQGMFLIDEGIVKGGNLYTEGVTVFMNKRRKENNND